MDWQLLKQNKVIDVKGFYTFFYFENGKNFCSSGERHNFWEMVYVDSGELSVVADNAGYRLPQGNVIFHKPMEYHAHASANGSPSNMIVVTFEIRSPEMDFFCDKIFELNNRQKKIMASFLDEAKRAFTGLSFDSKTGGFSGNYAAYQLAVSQLERLLLDIIREDNSFDRNKKLYSDARKNIENALAVSIKEYLKENVCGTLTLTDVCGYFNMSKSYICRLFREETGKGVIDFYSDLKIEQAKILIRKGELNFTQISEILGYSCIHSFTRSFKAKTGMTPSVYERSVR